MITGWQSAFAVVVHSCFNSSVAEAENGKLKTFAWFQFTQAGCVGVLVCWFVGVLVHVCR